MHILTLVLTLAYQDGAPAQTTAKTPSPYATSMEPKVGKPGSIVVVNGYALGDEQVDEVFLTDHRTDVKVKVLEQSGNTIKLRVPPFVKPGRQQLLILTKGARPVYLEQPVYLLVESEEPQETAAAVK